MARSTIPFALPPFRGLTRRIVLVVLAYWAVNFLLMLRNPDAAVLLTLQLSLRPDEALHGHIWQPITYPLVHNGPEIISMLFGLLSFWFFGSALEEERGALWLGEFCAVASVGGGLLASIVSLLFFKGNLAIGPTGYTWGLASLNMLLLLAYARLHPEREITFNFILRMKVKYLAAIYILLVTASSLTSGHKFDVFVTVAVVLCGFLYLRFAPYRGWRWKFSEQVYGVRNAYARQKRRRAAKKFKVYMREQGKDVNLDSSGRYVSLDDERRDPNDKSWMN